MNRFGLHVGGTGFREFGLCLSGSYKAEVMGDIETIQAPESQNTHECMKGTGGTLGSRKPMSQEENPVIHLHLFFAFCLNA